MVTFVPRRPGRLAEVTEFERGVGGAESNVACALARAGHSARWISRVGTDAFGDHLLAAVAAAGVDVRAVQRDPDRPTGVYFRTAGERPTAPAAPSAPTGPPAAPGLPTAAPGAPPADPAELPAEVVYYRAGSAAAALSPELVSRDHAWSGRVLHLSGITAALSDGCLALLRELTVRRSGRPLVSFDVNHRPALWRGRADAPAVLAELARRSDLVFVGEDEAAAVWGLHGASAVRAALPEPAALVVKHGSRGATAHLRSPDGSEAVAFVPALAVDVVAPVGAGDAFAAGYLSATLRGLPLDRRLRHGHLMAAAALTVPGDLAHPPPRDLADRLAALPPESWGTLRLRPGWTDGGGRRPPAPGPRDSPARDSSAQNSQAKEHTHPMSRTEERTP
ncbi:sugar kinase [Streptomyces sp. URMC 123]|uniref:sugar kinase n=1 Tax=Streptomyces sp. URMC 123 TaxID=3423403 RepID=UPI003F1A7E36